MSALYGADTPPPSATSNGFGHHSSSPSPFSKGVDDDDLAFESPKEEASYYRDKYRVAVDLLNETRAELDEFQLSSRELEQELEKELEVTEAKHADLQERIKRLEVDKDEWKTKFISLQKMHSSTVSSMQLEMDNLRSERDKTMVAIRELEMGNDELESKHRVTHSSLLDMDMKYNRAIEEKTLLEQEVIQKQELDEECQRLKDDVRDANNEIAILRDRLARAVVPTPPSSDAPMSPMLEKDMRSEAPSPTLTDGSATAQRSTHSAATGGTNRTDRSTTVTPRTVRQSPRIPRSTTTPVFSSPSVKRTLPAPSPSGIPALSRSTTTRNLSLSAHETAPMRRTHTTANVANQGAKTRGMRLLQDIQTRLRATDDRLGARMPKRSVIPPRKNTLSNSAPIASANAQHSRVAALSKQPPGGTVTPNNASSNLLSPTAWVLLSDTEDTPPARPGQRAEPSSPLEPARGVGARLLPQRPGIPSPLAPNLSRSQRASPGSTPTATSVSGRPGPKSARPSGRPPLSVSTGIGSSLLSSVRGPPRPPSRSHNRTTSRSGTMSPTFIPGPSRRASIGSQILSPTSSIASVSASGRSSRADVRPLSHSEMRPPSRSEYARPPSRSEYARPPSRSEYVRPPSRSDYARPPSRSDYARPPSRSDYARPPSRSDYVRDRPSSRLGVERVDERGERSAPRGSQGTGPRSLAHALGRGPAPGMDGRPMVQSASATSVASAVSAASAASHASLASVASDLSAASGASGASHASSVSSRSSMAPSRAHTSMPPASKTLRRNPRRSSVGVNEMGATPTGIPGPRTPGARPSSVPMFMDTPPPVPRIPSNLRRGV